MQIKSNNIIPQETRGYFIDDKMCYFNNPYFKWKVHITHIKSNRKELLHA